jgi:hypothetical protein
LLIAAAAAVALLAAAGIYWLWRAPSPPVPPAGSAASPTRAPVRDLGRGGLEVTASLPGAIVTVDDRALGPAPQSLVDLPAGPHRVRVELAGYLPWEQEAHVVPGVTTQLRARLSREGGQLHVECDVTGADVFVDRKYVGKAPLDLRDLAPGPHRLNVSMEGLEGYAETIDVSSGRQTVSVRLKEIRLDEHLDVIHRHALGSCSGRLSANAAGVRYDTANAKDAFEVPLSAIERLDVDYLKKNLALRLRHGRTYNFTTRDGNADALVVFRDRVEKARARLTASRAGTTGATAP